MQLIFVQEQIFPDSWKEQAATEDKMLILSDSQYDKSWLLSDNKLS